jgi:hypothetical protein
MTNIFRIRTLIFVKLETISIIRFEDKSGFNSHRGSECFSWSRSLIWQWTNSHLLWKQTFHFVAHRSRPLSHANRIQTLASYLFKSIFNANCPIYKTSNGLGSSVLPSTMYNLYPFLANMFRPSHLSWMHRPDSILRTVNSQSSCSPRN